MPALDGLRAIALVCVLGFHSGISWIAGGYLPLSTFFVLSGFMITALLLSERQREGRVDLVAFWGRRVRRLAPAALAALGVVAAYLTWGADGAQPGLRGDTFAALGWFANWRFILTNHPYADAFSDPSPLQHSPEQHRRRGDQKPYANQRSPMHALTVGGALDDAAGCGCAQGSRCRRGHSLRVGHLVPRGSGAGPATLVPTGSR